MGTISTYLPKVFRQNFKKPHTGDKTKRVNVEWESNRRKSWYWGRCEWSDLDGWKNETLHWLYIRFTFEVVLNGVWRDCFTLRVTSGLFGVRYGCESGGEGGMIVGRCSGSWSLMGAKVRVWIGWRGLGRMRGWKGLNGMYLEGFVGLERAEVWRGLRLLFWAFWWNIFADILPNSDYLVILWE